MILLEESESPLPAILFADPSPLDEQPLTRRLLYPLSYVGTPEVYPRPLTNPRRSGGSRPTLEGDAMGLISGAWRRIRREPVRTVRAIRAIQLENTARRVRRRKRKASTLRYQLQAWKAIQSDLGDLTLKELTRARLQAWVDAGGKAPTQRNRELRVLRAGYRQACIAWELESSADPFRGLEQWPERARERCASDRELAGIGAEARRLIADGPRGAAQAAYAVLLIALTGCRPGEILELEPAQVDLDNRALELADSKTGAKRVYLCSSAIEMLLAVDPNGSNRVFRTSRITLRRTWERIRLAIGAPDLRLADLRTTYDTLAGEAGIPVEDVAKLQSRSVECSAKHYRMLRSPHLAALAERVGERITQATEGSP